MSSNDEKEDTPPSSGNIAVENDPCPSRVEDNDGKRRHWEAPDFTITKVVHAEGDRRADLPRFGATGQIRLDRVACSGQISLDRLTSDFAYSKYFHRVHSGEVQIGNADSEVDKTLEKCIQSMHKGERCEAALRVRLNLRWNGLEEEADTASSASVWLHVECHIHLETLLNAQPIYKWYAETKLDKAREANAAAVRLFKAKRTLDAFHKFHLTLTLLTYVLEESGGKGEEAATAAAADDLRLTCYSNLAACQFQFRNFAHVVSLASRVLERQPDNVKLLYRRGVARLETKDDLDGAKADLVEAHRLDPSNRAINEKLGQLRVAERRRVEALSNGMKKMFN